MKSDLPSSSSFQQAYLDQAATTAAAGSLPKRNSVPSLHIRCGPWRSFEAVEFATLEWVDWFNHRRLLEPIGNIPPADAEARDSAQTEMQALAA